MGGKGKERRGGRSEAWEEEGKEQGGEELGVGRHEPQLEASDAATASEAPRFTHRHATRKTSAAQPRRAHWVHLASGEKKVAVRTAAAVRSISTPGRRSDTWQGMTEE